MKRKFLDFALIKIKKKYPEYDEIKLEELEYGLEGFYLTFTKLLVIIPLSIILGLFKEMMLVMIFFNIIRISAFGLHATKSWICLISSTIVFIGVPLIAKIIIIPFIIKIILGIISIILVYLYAPADTIKAPIIRKRRRDKLKFISTISCILLTFLYLIISNELLSNLIILSIWIEVTLISPFTYKLFKLSYNNYKTYPLKMD